MTETDGESNGSPTFSVVIRRTPNGDDGEVGAEEDAGEETEGPLGRAALERLGLRRTLEWPGLQGAATAWAVIGRDWFRS